MGRFEIEFSRNAARDYRKLPRDYKALIDLALRKLTEGLPVDIRPVVGEDQVYRIRVGKYRILFEIEGKTVLIARIRSRGDAYK